MSEFKLNYTGNEINEKLSKIDGIAENVNVISGDIAGDRSSISKDFDITYQVIKDGYIDTGKSAGTIISTDVIANNSWGHFIIPVKTGYRFKVAGVGGYPARQWCFVDNEYRVLSVSAAGISTESNITAPNDGFLICNVQITQSYSVKYTGYIGYAKSVEEDIDEFGELFVDYNITDTLILGGYVENKANIGSFVTIGVTPNESWYYRHFPVKKGETYKIIGKGGYAARLWSLFDDVTRLLAIAEPGATGEHIVRVKSDGYLTVNTEKVDGIGLYKIGAIGTKEGYLSAQKQTVKKFSWSSKPTEPYWILSLDCAKKYFSVDNIKIMIDRAAAAGFNQFQMQLSTNKGFRLALDDMTITDINGKTYDLTPCLGGDEYSEQGAWYTMSEMNDIIIYAQQKGLDFYPFIPTVSHMQRILTHFPQFRAANSESMLDITNEDAVNFAVALVERYANYFAYRKCHFYNFGMDECDFETYYCNGSYGAFVDFGNLIISTIKKSGLQPRMYGDGILYNNYYKKQFSRDVEVLCWKSATSDGHDKNMVSFNAVQVLNYKVINSSSWFYYIDGQEHIPTSTLETLDVLKYYAGLNKYFTYLPSGAALSIWCDNSVTTNPGDNGDVVVGDTEELITAFGRAIKNSLIVHGF